MGIINVEFTEIDLKFDMGFEHFQSITGSPNIEYYEGSYTVTPKPEEQTLETKNKYLVEDVVVKDIPYAEVTNNANGITVTIGGN